MPMLSATIPTGRTTVAAEKDLMATAETALVTAKSNYFATFEPSHSNLYLFWINFDFFVLDIDECTKNTHDCHGKAVCSYTEGSYGCSCKDVYQGDGRNCTGKIKTIIDIFFKMPFLNNLWC